MAGAEPDKAAEVAADTSSAKQNGWVVKELPSVGWVVSPMPPGEPEVPKEPLQLPQAEGKVKLPGVPEGDSPTKAPPEPAERPPPLPGLETSAEGASDLRDAGRSNEPMPSDKAEAPAASVLTRRSSGFDAFVVFAGGTKPTAQQAAAITRGLQARGLRVCQQSVLVGAVKHLSSSDEAHFMAQAAQSSECAVILLTRQFIQRVETGVFGDSCVAAFTLAKRLPNAVVAALEPELVSPAAWGWNQVFARFSGRAVVDLSMQESEETWAEAVDRLAWLLNPQLEIRPMALASPSQDSSTPSTRPPGASYDCFVSHNWGKDSQGRDNHQRVMQIAGKLEQHGIQVFLQDREAHRYSSADEAMVDGMRRSALALVFVTRTYIQKIEEGKVDEDCVAQFNLAKRAPAILPVILEPELAKIGKWGWNRVYAHLSGKMLVDLSRGDAAGFPSILWSATAQRMQCAVDLLELRVLQEAYRLHPKVMQAHPAPLLPHKDAILIAIVCFLAAALLNAAAVLGRVLLNGSMSAFLRVLALVAGVFWIAGFTLHSLWLVMKARLPPDFDIITGCVQPLALLASVVRAIAWVLAVLLHVVRLQGIEEFSDAQLNNSTLSSQDFPGDFSWTSLWQAHLFTAACVVCCLDAAVVSRGCCGSFQERWLSMNSLAGWAWVLMATAASFMSLAAQLETDAEFQPGLEILGAVSLLASCGLLMLWLLMHPSQLRQHFEQLATEAPSPQVAACEAPPEAAAQ